MAGRCRPRTIPPSASSRFPVKIYFVAHLADYEPDKHDIRVAYGKEKTIKSTTQSHLYRKDFAICCEANLTHEEFDLLYEDGYHYRLISTQSGNVEGEKLPNNERRKLSAEKHDILNAGVWYQYDSVERPSTVYGHITSLFQWKSPPQMKISQTMRSFLIFLHNKIEDRDKKTGDQLLQHLINILRCGESWFMQGRFQNKEQGLANILIQESLKLWNESKMLRTSQRRVIHGMAIIILANIWKLKLSVEECRQTIDLLVPEDNSAYPDILGIHFKKESRESVYQNVVDFLTRNTTPGIEYLKVIPLLHSLMYETSQPLLSPDFKVDDCLNRKWWGMASFFEQFQNKIKESFLSREMTGRTDDLRMLAALDPLFLRSLVWCLDFDASDLEIKRVTPLYVVLAAVYNQMHQHKDFKNNLRLATQGSHDLLMGSGIEQTERDKSRLLFIAIVMRMVKAKSANPSLTAMTIKELLLQSQSVHEFDEVNKHLSTWFKGIFIFDSHQENEEDYIQAINILNNLSLGNRRNMDMYRKVLIEWIRIYFGQMTELQCTQYCNNIIDGCLSGKYPLALMEFIKEVLPKRAKAIESQAKKMKQKRKTKERPQDHGGIALKFHALIIGKGIKDVQVHTDDGVLQHQCMKPVPGFAGMYESEILNVPKIATCGYHIIVKTKKKKVPTATLR